MIFGMWLAYATGGVAKAKKSPLLPCSACASSETIAVPFLWSHVAPSAALRPRLIQRDALAVPSAASTVGCASALACPLAHWQSGVAQIQRIVVSAVERRQRVRQAVVVWRLGSFSKGGVLACTGGVAHRG